MKVTDSGENISKELVEFLESNGIIFDKNTTTFHLDNYKKTKFYPSGRADIINNQFKDLFFLELQKEINLTWKLGLFTSTIILSRKLIENLVIEILRKKFPLNSSPTNLDLYYDKSKGRFHNFSHMLEILELKKGDFGPDENTISKFLSKVKPIKFNSNSATHSIIEFPEEKAIYAFDIQE